ncbi:MAG: hypothetical protein H6728_02945 [Myxococcales bacterium]|nr:hypothetical protein [Myxococcales bacterium]MCB9642011.1 hypothetical protein [Myxococcales bacterium]
MQVHAEDASKEQLYLRALEQFQKKQYKEASATLEALFKLLTQEQQKQEKGTRSWHMMTLGRADALHYLADATWQQKEKYASCRRLVDLEKLLSSLPKGWESWPLQPSLISRLKASRARLQSDCAALPSTLVFDLSPVDAKIVYQNKEGVWFPLKGKILQTTQTQLHIKVTAKGYQDLQLKRAVPRWSRVEWPILLKRVEPKRVIPPVRIRVTSRPTSRRIAVIRRPPKPLVKAAPFYQTWWFWTITGAVVAGAVATTVVVVVTHEPRYVFKGDTPTTPFKVW